MAMSRQPNAILGSGWGGSRLSPTVLAVVFVAAGVLVLVDASLVARFSVALVAGAAIAVGGFELIQGLTRRPWTRAAPRCALGILYIAFGLALLRHEEIRAALLTNALALVLIISGGIRIALGAGRAAGARWLLLSGVVGVAAGLSIFFGWPASGARWISIALGVDLLIHGLAWLMIALTTRNSE
jgi:uncharacterized membrane protein HdeD (DUF308 family)